MKMKMVLCPVLLLLVLPSLIIPCHGHGILKEPETHHVNAKATPKKIELGISKSLSVNCTLSDCKTSGLKRIISLTLSACGDESRDVPVDLASVGLFHEETPALFPAADDAAVASGHLDETSEASLSLTWRHPTSDLARQYRCSVVGLDDRGQAVNLEDSVEVSVETPDLSLLLDNMLNLQEQVNDVETGLKEELSSLRDTMIFRFNKLDTVESSSAAFNGHVYYLTKRGAFSTIAQAASLCESFHGYLAEIHSKTEFDFIRSFLRGQSGFERVLISGTDEGHEGRWVHPRTNNPLSYFNWGGSEPNGGAGENDVGLHLTFSWAMYDVTFSSSYITNSDVRCLCEVAEP